MNDVVMLSDLFPIVALLFFGIATVIVSRLIRLSPIVGYLALGIAARATDVPIPFGESTRKSPPLEACCWASFSSTSAFR
jgi:Kef-type K+ transport system membrane component KefB